MAEKPDEKNSSNVSSSITSSDNIPQPSKEPTEGEDITHAGDTLPTNSSTGTVAEDTHSSKKNGKFNKTLGAKDDVPIEAHTSQPTKIEKNNEADSKACKSTTCQPRPNDKIEVHPPFEIQGYAVQIAGEENFTHFSIDDKYFVEMKNGSPFNVVLSNHNEYSCDVDVTLGGNDVGGYWIDKDNHLIVHNDVYGGGRFVFYSDTSSSNTGDGSNGGLVSELQIKFIPEAYGIWCKMRGDQSATNVCVLKKAGAKLQEVLEKLAKRRKFQDTACKGWCFSDGKKTFNVATFISVIVGKQSKEKPLWVFQEKETITVKVDGEGDRKLQIELEHMHPSYLKDEVHKLFDGDHKIQSKIAGEDVTNENYLMCLMGHDVIVTKEEKKVQPTPGESRTATGDSGGYRGLTRGFSGHAASSQFRGLDFHGTRGYDDSDDEDILRTLSDNTRLGFVRFEGEPVHRHEEDWATAAAQLPFHTSSEDKVVFTINLVLTS